jgi:hypothetical protein
MNAPAGQSETPKSGAIQEGGFKEVRRRKQHSTNKTAPNSMKAVLTALSAAVDTPPKEVATWNFFVPLRVGDTGSDSANSEATPREAAAPAKTGRPPPIVLTSAVNLILLQKHLKGVVIENFEFRGTRNGTRVITRNMVDFESVKSHFDSQNLSYYSFFPKSEKPIKAVIRHLPHNTLAEDTSDALVSLGFNVVSVKQMSHPSVTSEVPQIINLPLFLVTSPRTAKSQEIFRLLILCHIAIRVEAYRAQNALTQCHNYQQFGYVWANCKQLPRCLWCGVEHLHKDRPERGDTASTPTRCNCQLAEGGKAHPTNYRGCRHEHLQKRKSQRTPKTTTGGRSSQNSSPQVGDTEKD